MLNTYRRYRYHLNLKYSLPANQSTAIIVITANSRLRLYSSDDTGYHRDGTACTGYHPCYLQKLSFPLIVSVSVIFAPVTLRVLFRYNLFVDVCRCVDRESPRLPTLLPTHLPTLCSAWSSRTMTGLDGDTSTDGNTSTLLYIL